MLLATQWQKADFAAMLQQGLKADVDYRRMVLLERRAVYRAERRHTSGSVRIVRYENTNIVNRSPDASSGGFVVLNDFCGICGGARASTASPQIFSKPMCAVPRRRGARRAGTSYALPSSP